MPTPEDILELFDNTNIVWTTIRGINGNLFVSNTNSNNKIFIPAAGRREDSTFEYINNSGLLWSSTIEYGSTATCLDSENSYNSLYSLDFHMGCCLRGVCDPTSEGIKKIKPELLANYTTKSEIEAVKSELNTTINSIDHSKYAEKTELTPINNAISAVQTELTTAEEKLEEIENVTAAALEDLNSRIGDVDIDLSAYATKEELPTYWANVELQSASSTETTPQFKTVNIGGGCTLQYDDTNSCVKFVF